MSQGTRRRGAPERTQFEAALSSLRESFERLEQQHRRLVDDPSRLPMEDDQELSRLRRRLELLEEENGRLTAQLHGAAAAPQAQSDLLAHLYVAGFHLHRTLQMDAVITSIREILINLVGSERYAIYLMDGAGGSLVQVADDGQSAPAPRPIPLAEGILGVVAKTGIPFFDADRQAGDFHNPVACVPMKADGRVLGVIQVMKLLSHKKSLNSQDHEIFTLLAETAGNALVSALLRRRFLGEAPAGPEAWRQLLQPVLSVSDGGVPAAEAAHGNGRRPA